MPRKINQKCFECANTHYIRGHKPECYNSSKCRRKRAYYHRHEHYRQYLRDNHIWLKFRKDRCFVCGSKENLEVQHVKPRCRGGLSVPGNVVTLCVPCHKVITIYETKLGYCRKNKPLC